MMCAIISYLGVAAVASSLAPSSELIYEKNLLFSLPNMMV